MICGNRFPHDAGTPGCTHLIDGCNHQTQPFFIVLHNYRFSLSQFALSLSCSAQSTPLLSQRIRRQWKFPPLLSRSSHYTPSSVPRLPHSNHLYFYDSPFVFLWFQIKTNFKFKRKEMSTQPWKTLNLRKSLKLQNTLDNNIFTSAKIEITI